MISKRRRMDDEDDLSLCFGALFTSTMPMTNTDELGRIAPEENFGTSSRARITARSGRRLLRRARVQTKEEEGYSTDASLPSSDAADFETAMEKLREKGSDILYDVRAKDFKNPELGLGRWFGEWRERFSDSYTGAWGGLGMVGGWEFWTRLEILGWNPLEVSLVITNPILEGQLHS